MAATSGSVWRTTLVVALATLGCVTLLLFCVRVAVAQPVVATWYGPGFEGNLTANGEVFDPSGYTAAHKTYAFGTKLVVTYEGRSIVVRINDRGPFVAGRDLDLSQGSAEYLGLTAVGVATVDAEVVPGSTQVGPYARRANNASNDTTGNTDQNRPARRQSSGGANDGTDGAAATEQYAAEDQYAANQGQEVAPEPAPPAPKPATPVLPPEPEPEELLSPPEELAVPNSTVQKRVEFEIAAAPQPVEEEPAAEELTVLPDTAGAPLSVPVAGALLVALGISVRILRR